MTLDINSAYVGPEFHSQFTSGTDNRSVLHKPYKVCHLVDFAQSDGNGADIKTCLNQSREFLSKEGYAKQESDLYSYSQSSVNFASCTEDTVKGVVKFFKTKVRKWLENLTGIPLKEELALTSSIYEQGDYLLCHDDEVRDRRVAFIWYISESELWTAADGGLLQIFDANDEKEPTDIVHSFTPQSNSFAFFLVSPGSYHQVSEVLADKKRVSINGWFHGEPLQVQEMDKISAVPIPIKPCQLNAAEDVLGWINPMYVNPEVQAQIRETFCSESEIELPDFLNSAKYEQLIAELSQTTDDTWRSIGPPSKQRLEVFRPATTQNANYPVTQHVLQLMRSEPMFLILSQLTGLTLHPHAEERQNDDDDAPGCSSEPPAKKPCQDNATNGTSPHECYMTCVGALRRWSPGTYSLLHDQSGSTQASLDARLCILRNEWDDSYGGYTVFLDKTEGDEIVRVNPKANNLTLVYKEEGIACFTKYISRRTSSSNEGIKSFEEYAFEYFE